MWELQFFDLLNHYLIFFFFLFFYRSPVGSRFAFGSSQLRIIILAGSINCASRHELTKVTYICGSLTGVQGTPGVLVGLPEASQKKIWSTSFSLLGENDMLSSPIHPHPGNIEIRYILVMLRTTAKRKLRLYRPPIVS